MSEFLLAAAGFAPLAATARKSSASAIGVFPSAFIASNSSGTAISGVLMMPIARSAMLAPRSATRSTTTCSATRGCSRANTR